MKYSMWITVALALMLSSGIALAQTSPAPTAPPPNAEEVQTPPAVAVEEVQAPPVSAADEAENQRQDFVARANVLNDRKIVHDREATELNRQITDLQGELKQLQLELKRIKQDQASVRHDLKDLDREKSLFAKREKLTRKLERAQSGGN